MITAKTAAKHTLFDEAFTIIQQTNKGFLVTHLDEILYHFCVNNRLEQAKQIFSMADNKCFVAQQIYELCKSLKKIDVHTAQSIASEFLPLIEQEAVYTLETDETAFERDNALDVMMSVFNCYILLDDSQKYVPVLTGISLKSVFLRNSEYYLEALHLVLGAALDRHLYEYAISIYEETPWTDTLRCRVMQSFLRYCCRNHMIADAKQFCSQYSLSEFDLIRSLFDTLIVLNVNGQSEIAKLISSEASPI